MPGIADDMIAARRNEEVGKEGRRETNEVMGNIAVRVIPGVREDAVVVWQRPPEPIAADQGRVISFGFKAKGIRRGIPAKRGYLKIGAHNRAEATAYAFRQQIAPAS
jgi:hypothetical protein